MAIPPPHNRWLYRFAVLTAAITLLLLVAGGLVTSHGVGMAVPDWPNTYGYNMFLFPVSQWVGGVLFEHSHRLIAALVGLLTAILAVWLWVRETRGWNCWLGVAGVVAVLALLGARNMPVYVLLAAVSVVVMVAAFWRFKNNSGVLRWLGVVALAAVILQGVIGGLRVVWLKDEIGVFHATLAQLFFALTCMIALFTSRWWKELPSPMPADRKAGRVTPCAPIEPSDATCGAHGVTRPTSPLEPGEQLPFPVRKLRGWVLATTLLILGQLILGSMMRHQHAGLAIPDFPRAYGKLWPAMDAGSVARYNQQRIEVEAANPITAFQIGLQMAHRLTALAILIGAGAVALRSRRREEAVGSRVGKIPPPCAGGHDAILRRLASVWLGLILAQIALGAWTIWSNKAADVATAHVLMGALSLVTGVLLYAISSRHSPLRTDLASGQNYEMVPGGTVFENRDDGGCRQMT